MMSISRLIVGLLFILFGIALIILSFFTHWLMLIYGIPLLIIGIVLLLNKNEDKIEQRKDMMKGGKLRNKNE